MKVSKEQEDLYKKTMEAAKKELVEMDSQMEKELQKIREKLAEMQESKKYFRQIYEGAAQLLGIEFESDGDGEGLSENGGKASPTMGKTTIDQSKRAEIYREAQQVMYDEVAAIPVAHSTVIWPMLNNVMNFKLHPTGSVRMKNVWKQ